MSEPSPYSGICRDGLWSNNAGLVQLLGLCPLLAVTTTLTNALALGLATTATLAMTSLAVSVSRRWLRPQTRIPAFVVIIASTVTVIELVMSAQFHELSTRLGIFLPLIVTNCLIVARAEVFASRQPVLPAVVDGLMSGLGFALVLLAVGGLRELVGYGTLFARAELLFGEAARDWTVTLPGDYPGLLLAILPPGAFLALALLIATRNHLDARIANRRSAPQRHVHE